MKVRIDKAGRIVLPKPVRQRFNLTAGASLELAEAGDGILLRPVGQRPALIRKDGLLVYRGKAPRRFDWDRLVEDLRDDRLRETAAL